MKKFKMQKQISKL